jgi:hypothetical protein
MCRTGGGFSTNLRCAPEVNWWGERPRESGIAVLSGARGRSPHRHLKLPDDCAPQVADNQPQTANSPGARRRIGFDWIAGRTILFSL